MNDDISVLERLARVDDARLAPLAEHPCVEELFQGITGASQEARAGWRPSRRRTVRDVTGRQRAVAVPFGIAAVVAVAVLVLGLLAVLSPAGTGSRTGAPGWRLTGDVTGWTVAASAAGPEEGGLSCPDATTCYVTGPGGATTGINSLYASDDGGASWSGPRTLPAGIAFSTTLDCPTQDDCLAGGRTSGPTDSTGTVLLLQTTDGGQSWQQTPVPGGGGLLRAVSCPSSETCFGLADRSAVTFAVGLGPTYGEGSAEPTTFLATTDGGLTWSQSAFPAEDTIALLDCTTTSSCVAAGVQFGSTPSGGSSPSGVVLTSDDGGSTWTTSTLPAGTGEPVALDCPSAADCFAVGTASETVPTSSVTGCYRSGSGASEMCVGQAGPTTTVRTSEAYRSTDGGTTWEAVPFPTSPPDVVASQLSCPTTTQCWVSGRDAARHTETSSSGTMSTPTSPIVLTTQDAGATWVTVTPPVAATPGTSTMTPGGRSRASAAGSGVVTTLPGTSTMTPQTLAILRCPASDDCVAMTFPVPHPLVFTYGGDQTG